MSGIMTKLSLNVSVCFGGRYAHTELDSPRKVIYRISRQYLYDLSRFCDENGTK